MSAALRCKSVAMRAGRASTSRTFKPALRPLVPARVGARRMRVVAKVGDADNVPSAYAAALIDLAQGKNALEAIHADVDTLSSLLRENAKVKEFIMNPVISEDRKKTVFAKIGKEAGFQQYTLNFLSLLLEKSRLDMLEMICDAFELQYCQATDTQVATVRSAVKLEQEQQFLIAKKLQELTGSKNIKLKPIIDQTLIAGFVVEYGSTSIDLSIKGQMEKITGELLAKYSEKAMA